jgi:hypothetical protein
MPKNTEIKVSDEFINPAREDGRLATGVNVHNYTYDADAFAWVPQEGSSGGPTSNVSVSNWPASQAVAGPLTDTELRDTPVPVSFVDPGESQIVYESGDILYVCKAPIGSSKSGATWQIKKVDGMDITWCDGDDEYDNVATSLAVVEALSFS